MPTAVTKLPTDFTSERPPEAKYSDAATGPDTQAMITRRSETADRRRNRARGDAGRLRDFGRAGLLAF
jgi:hypothetical protein